MSKMNFNDVQLNLNNVCSRTGISTRKLRYCLDHTLIPGVKIHLAVDECGRLRTFSALIGFLLVCAVKLLEIGLPHKKIRVFMGGLREILLDCPKNLRIEDIFTRDREVLASFADGVNLRLEVRHPHYDSGWLAPGNPAKLDPAYAPTWTVILDLGRLRDEVWHGPPPATKRSPN